MNKRILVTGGAGFLGSHLCEKLLNNGNKVICVDNFSTGAKENIFHLFDNQSFEFLQYDIISPLNIEVNEIYHLACPASPIHYQIDPIKTTKTSVLGSINMLDLALRNNAKVLFASTSEIYGDPLIHPQKEDYWGNVNPIGIRSCYDEGKRCAETLFFDYHRQYDVKIKVARIFNTYGSRMHPDDGRVVSNFINQALKNRILTIYGNGNQSRSFCYVTDLINGIIKLMKTNDDFTGPINLGNTNEIKIFDLANKIIDKTNSKSEIHFDKLPENDPCRRKPDIALAQKMIDWEPKIDLERGLSKTIEYFYTLLQNSTLLQKN